MILVDASVWIDLLRGNDTPEVSWLDERLGSKLLGVTDLTICEVLQGVPERQVELVQKRLLALVVLPTGGTELALAAARSYRGLRRRGITVRGTIDCWLATFCIMDNHSLLHSDRDFDAFEKHLGLKVIHPLG